MGKITYLPQVTLGQLISVISFCGALITVYVNQQRTEVKQAEQIKYMIETTSKIATLQESQQSQIVRLSTIVENHAKVLDSVIKVKN